METDLFLLNEIDWNEKIKEEPIQEHSAVIG